MLGFACLGIVPLFYCFYPVSEKEYSAEIVAWSEDNTKNEEAIVELKDIFYFDKEYREALLGIENVKKEENIPAIIIPHHLVASDMIAKQIRAASGREIKQVVVIGPNHENVGGDALNSLNANWETPFGVLRGNNFLIEKFLADFKAQPSMEVFENEHSIGGIAPFVRDILEDVQFLPIVASSYAEFDDILKLSDWLDDNLPADSLIIYSIDFSHYLTKEEADKNDKIVREIMIHHDVESALKLNNDYVDSPCILALALLRSKNKNYEISINENANSFDYSIIKPIETTSYFTVSFYKSERMQ